MPSVCAGAAVQQPAVLGKRGPVGDFAAMAPPSGVPTTSARGQLMTRPPRRWLLTGKHRFQLVGKHGWVSGVPHSMKPITGPHAASDLPPHPEADHHRQPTPPSTNGFSGRSS